MRSRCAIGARRLAAVGLLGAVWIPAGCRRAAEPSEAGAAERRRLPVTAVKVSRNTIRGVVYATGTARAVKREYLYFEGSGTVRYVMKGPRGRELREGDPVKKGDTLARLDERSAKADLAVTEASLAEAIALLENQKAEHRRNESLIKRKAISQSTYELSQTQTKVKDEGVKSARARLDQAKVALDHLALRSPIDGVIGYLNIREGYYFGQQSIQSQSEQELLETIPCIVLDTSEFEITVDVPSTEATRVKAEQLAHIARDDDLVRASLRVDAVTDFKHVWLIPGRVFSVNPAVSPGGRSVQVKVRTRKGQRLKDGSYTTCWIIAQEKSDAVTVPYRCLLFEEGRPYCFTVDRQTNRTTRRNLKLGIYGLTHVEVQKDLKPNEWVVDKGKHNLSDESAVEIVAAEGGEKQP